MSILESVIDRELVVRQLKGELLGVQIVQLEESTQNCLWKSCSISTIVDDQPFEVFFTLFVSPKNANGVGDSFEALALNRL